MPFLLRSLFLFYRWTIHPIIHLLSGAGAGCRFEPSCSHYAEDAFKKYSPYRATILTVGRILRCQPFARGGFDPVPEPVVSEPTHITLG